MISHVDDVTTDNRADCKRHHEIGRMEMLFELVNAGKLTLDEAADFTGMTWGEAADMLQGWQEAQKM